MSLHKKPIVISAPLPRSLELIFAPQQREFLFDQYEVHECESDEVGQLPKAILSQAHYIIGQPPLTHSTLLQMSDLKCIFNVESNLINNMPYDYLFEKGIHVVTTGAVFADPVAELGLALALCLARNVIDSDIAFRNGKELWGGDGNHNASLISGSNIGLIGFGDLGKSLARLLLGFRTTISAYDPWLPPSILEEQGVTSSTLQDVLEKSDIIFVVASVTSENKGFLNANSFQSMKSGALFILLSRAEVVNFDDLMAAVESGHIQAASDVFTEEPLATDHSVRQLKGFIRSAHRAGALDSAFKKMGDMVLEDMNLMDKGLPPMRCKRAERETVSRMRSKPVDQN